MQSRYDYMRDSLVQDIDGENFPDPLTVDYQSVIDQTSQIPSSYTLTRPNLKKLWKVYYENTGLTEMDDVVYTLNGIEHVGMLEPGDQIYLFDTNKLSQFSFKNLED